MGSEVKHRSTEALGCLAEALFLAWCCVWHTTELLYLYALVAHVNVQMRTCLDLYEALLRSIETSRPHLVAEKFDLPLVNEFSRILANCALRMQSTLYYSSKQSFYSRNPLCSIQSIGFHVYIRTNIGHAGSKLSSRTSTVDEMKGIEGTLSTDLTSGGSLTTNGSSLSLSYPGLWAEKRLSASSPIIVNSTALEMHVWQCNPPVPDDLAGGEYIDCWIDFIWFASTKTNSTCMSKFTTTLGNLTIS